MNPMTQNIKITIPLLNNIVDKHLPKINLVPSKDMIYWKQVHVYEPVDAKGKVAKHAITGEGDRYQFYLNNCVCDNDNINAIYFNIYDLDSLGAVYEGTKGCYKRMEVQLVSEHMEDKEKKAKKFFDYMSKHSLINSENGLNSLWVKINDKMFVEDSFKHDFVDFVNDMTHIKSLHITGNRTIPAWLKNEDSVVNTFLLNVKQHPSLESVGIYHTIIPQINFTNLYKFVANNKIKSISHDHTYSFEFKNMIRDICNTPMELRNYPLESKTT